MMQPASVFTDQSPDNLYLSLVQGPLDADRYSILWEQSLQISNIEVTARVIGASHIMTFAVDEVVLHEMLACTEPPHDVDSYRLPLRADESHRVDRSHAQLRYTFESLRENWTDHEPEALVRLVEQVTSLEENCFGTVYAFPQGTLPAIPKTVLWGSSSHDGRGVVIKTAHSYPGQAVVFSYSSITRADNRET